MNNYIKIFLLFLIVIALMYYDVALADSPRHRQQFSISKVDKTAVQNQFTMEGNNWAFEMTNYGPYAQDISGRLPGGGAGGEFPRGTGTYVIFAAGIQIGALVNGVPTVSVVDFDSEFQPGALEKTDPYDSTEVPRATDPGAAVNKLFALGSDGSDGTPIGTDGDGVDDYSNWPSQYGAPTRADGSPLVVGDLMSWCVYNDMDRSRHTIPNDENMEPLGLEVQQASIQVNITGYSDVFFMYYKIINKGTRNLSDVYVAAWFDADVDNAGNDLVATDSLTNMVFTYNSDNTDPHSLGGSAFGADFFQGPVVPGDPTDTAKYLELTPDGFVQRVVPGKKVLGLSTTVRYINVRGPDGDPDNDTELYNLMRGLQKNGDPRPNRFTFPEDPVAGNPALLDPRPDDKRMMLCTGPFSLAVGDIQIVVLACVGGKGTDRINAIENLRATDLIAQQAYDAKFLLPQPPPSPRLIATPLDGRVVLQWDNSSEIAEDRYPQLAGISIPSYRAYDFAGYKVYRSPDGTVGSWTEIAQFDKADGITEIPETTWFVQDVSIKSLRRIPIGDDKGVQYSFIDENVFNGQVYYYAVTAYDAQPDIRSGAAPVTLESAQSRNAVKAVPRPPSLGNVVTAGVQDTASHIGNSGGSVLVSVVDPTKVTGHTYKVVFENVTITDTLDSTSTTDIYWRLWDVDKGAYVQFTKADNPRTDVDESYLQLNQASAADPASENNFVTADGLLIRVYGPALDFKNFLVVANASGPLDPPDMGCFAFNVSGFPTFDGNDRPSDNQQVGGGHWGVHTGNIDDPDNASYEFFKFRVTQDGARWPLIVPYDWEIRYTSSGGYGFEPNAFVTGSTTGGTVIPVPFELWRIGIGTLNDSSDDVRLFPYILDVNGNGQFDLDGIDHPISGGDNDPETDWIYWVLPADQSAGQNGYDTLLGRIQSDPSTYEYLSGTDGDVMRRMVFVNWNGGSVSDPTFPGNVNQAMPESGTIFRIITTKPNLPADTFMFTTTSKPAFSSSLASSRLNKNHIKVVPNPYYGFSAYDQNQFNRRVKITGLPDVCTIRIFNVAGDLVRAIQHNGTSNNDRSSSGSEFTSIEIWNLTSDNGIFISSGVYFLHIDAPGIGQSKELIPFAIIQGNVQLTVPTN
ncbi:MAG: hypothetical protein HY707_07835 [Ignavibacteriae bacterium]|nr:hypothetical protein [Ignavibacteriota bacterium]